MNNRKSKDIKEREITEAKKSIPLKRRRNSKNCSLSINKLEIIQEHFQENTLKEDYSVCK